MTHVPSWLEITGLDDGEIAAFLAYAHKAMGGEMVGTELYAHYVQSPEAFRCDYRYYLSDVVAPTDPRTPSQRATDIAAGNTEPTKLDIQYGKVRTAAYELFGNRQTLKYLLLGMECYTYVCMAVDGGAKRSKAVSRLEELLRESGIGIEPRVNDWIAVFMLACLCTGKKTVADMPVEWIGSVSYHTLADLKIGIESDKTGLHYAFKRGWSDFIEEAIANGITGDRLEESINKHKEELKGIFHAEAREGLSPERVAQLDAEDVAREMNKRVVALDRAISALTKAASDANYSPDDLLPKLVKAKVITPPEPIIKPFDAEDIARTLDADSAAKLADALCQRGDYKVIMAIASVLTGYLRANANGLPAPSAA